MVIIEGAEVVGTTEVEVGKAEVAGKGVDEVGVAITVVGGEDVAAATLDG